MNDQPNNAIPDIPSDGSAVIIPQVEWYVLRVTYQRELQAKGILDKLNIESFVPVRLVRRRDAQGRERDVCKALLHNYIFVHADKSTVKRIKTENIPYLRYVMHTQNGESCMMIVPEAQMRSFIAVAGSDDQRVMWLAPEATDLSKGMKVRITGGVFAGVEGILSKVDGARDRRVVVKIEGVAAVATASVPLEFIEKITD